jgi:hypothetical protein
MTKTLRPLDANGGGLKSAGHLRVAWSDKRRARCRDFQTNLRNLWRDHVVLPPSLLRCSSAPPFAFAPSNRGGSRDPAHGNPGGVLVWAKRQKKAPGLPARRCRSRPSRISHRFSTEPNPKVRITINRTASMLMYGPPWPLVFQPKAPVCDGARRAVQRTNNRDRRTAHGNGTAFSAVAPSERPVFAAHRSNIREWYCPQARIAGHLTFQPLVQFQPAPRLSVGPIRIVQECGALATYRPVSCAFTSTICGCVMGVRQHTEISHPRQ